MPYFSDSHFPVCNESTKQKLRCSYKEEKVKNIELLAIIDADDCCHSQPGEEKRAACIFATLGFLYVVMEITAV